MRIGNDLLMFTKKNNLSSILFISETFLRREKIQDVNFISIFKIIKNDSDFIKN